MAKEGNYRQDKKCPKCDKRKVYVVPTKTGYKYICKACNEEWGED